MFRKTANGVYEFSRRFWVTLVVVLAMMSLIAWNTQRINNRTEQVYAETVAYAKQTNECLNQLLKTSQLRARLNIARDDLSEHQRYEFLAMFQQLLDPPGNIVVLSPIDPVRQKWVEDTAKAYLLTIAADQQKVENIKAELAANPIPDPTCGNKLPGE